MAKNCSWLAMADEIGTIVNKSRGLKCSYIRQTEEKGTIDDVKAMELWISGTEPCKSPWTEVWIE